MAVRDGKYRHRVEAENAFLPMESGLTPAWRTVVATVGLVGTGNRQRREI